jgi:ABC-2 type transport system ATP-binding protein
MTQHFAVETHALVRRYGGRTALDQLTLAIPRGGVHALVGRNGAGKSTLFRILLGLDTASSGTARVLGVDSRALDAATRGRIGYVGEDQPLPGWWTVAELAALERSGRPRWNETTFREIASQFELAGERRVGELSRGERAGLALALAVAPGPELLLLDEPTAGLDLVASRGVLEALLFGGAHDLGTVVLASHRADEIERIADHVIVLDHGGVLAAGSPEDLRQRVSAWTIAEWPTGVDVASFPGRLDARTIDGFLQLIMLDAQTDLARQLESRGARGVHRATLGFERALDALLGSRAASRRIGVNR